MTHAANADMQQANVAEIPKPQRFQRILHIWVDGPLWIHKANVDKQATLVHVAVAPKNLPSALSDILPWLRRSFLDLAEPAVLCYLDWNTG